MPAMIDKLLLARLIAGRKPGLTKTELTSLIRYASRFAENLLTIAIETPMESWDTGTTLSSHNAAKGSSLGASIFRELHRKHHDDCKSEGRVK